MDVSYVNILGVAVCGEERRPVKGFLINGGEQVNATLSSQQQQQNLTACITKYRCLPARLLSLLAIQVHAWLTIRTTCV